MDILESNVSSTESFDSFETDSDIADTDSTVDSEDMVDEF